MNSNNDNIAAALGAAPKSDKLNESITICGNHRVVLDVYLPKDASSESLAPAVLILPGGAFLFPAPSEGEPVALRMADEGYAAFVLGYSTHASGRRNKYFIPQLGEVAESMYIIRSRAEEWDIDPDRICLMGFSAGGNIAACYGSYWKEGFIYNQYKERCHASGIEEVWDGVPVRPAACVLSYPLLDHTSSDEWFEKQGAEPDMKMIKASNISAFGTEDPDDETLRRGSPLYFASEDAPPTFIWHTMEDEMVDPMQSMRYAGELYRLGVPCELHMFQKGLHALSLADESVGHAGEPSGQWVGLMLNWLDRIWNIH